MLWSNPYVEGFHKVYVWQLHVGWLSSFGSSQNHRSYDQRANGASLNSYSANILESRTKFAKFVEFDWKFALSLLSPYVSLRSIRFYWCICFHICNAHARATLSTSVQIYARSWNSFQFTLTALLNCNSGKVGISETHRRAMCRSEFACVLFGAQLLPNSQELISAAHGTCTLLCGCYFAILPVRKDGAKELILLRKFDGVEMI